MKKKSKYLRENLTFMGIKNYLNANFSKKSGKPFTEGDVQGYLRRKALPRYLGGIKIEEVRSIPDVKLYNLLR